MSVLKQLVDEKFVKVLSILYKNKSQFFHLTYLASSSKVPSATTLRIIRKLAELKLVSVSVVGKLKIYRWNDTDDNKRIMELILG